MKFHYTAKILRLCLLLIPLMGIGQNLDSLEQALKKQDITASEKIKLYDDLSWFYNSVDVKRSLTFGKKGLELAKKNGDKKMEATFYRNMGVAYFMGSVYDTATIYLDKAKPIALQLNDYRMQASIYNTYANIYRVQSAYDKAIENYLNAAQVLETNKDLHKLTLVYSNIGGTYQIIHNYEQALFYLKKAEKLAIQNGDDEGLVSVYISLSDIGLYNDIPKEESISYAQRAIELCRKIGNKFSENKALQTLAKIYYHHDDYDKAEPLALQSVSQAKKLGFPRLIAEGLSLVTSIYLYQGRYTESIAIARETLKIDSTDTNISISVYSNLAQAYAYLGNPDSTQTYLNHYRVTVDKFANQSYQSSLSAMEVKYETEKKELKITALEKQRQLYIWLGIAGTVILLIALAFAFIRYRLAVSRRKLAEKEKQQLEQERQLVAVQATLDGEAAERSRLAKDLHDGLGGMLSAVKLNLPQLKGDAAVLETIDVNRFQKALGMLDDSIQELRRVAHHMMPESLLRYGLKISLSDFCDAIPAADFHYFGDEARLPEKLEIMVYRCIHELVNNALKHAEASHINVQLIQEDDRLSFTVQDNGKGFDQHTATEGMGLHNIRQRVEAFKGQLNIYSTPKGTEVHVELELTQTEQDD
ncbi:tetratricopeptide repeat-containing sensor histidine kinase [Sinomicrobium sp.]